MGRYVKLGGLVVVGQGKQTLSMIDTTESHHLFVSHLSLLLCCLVVRLSSLSYLSYLYSTSIPLNCPYCKAGTRTITRDEIDCCTITVFIVLLLVFWPVCWLPFVLPDCKNTKHNCANCGRLVGETPACDGCCK